jgi:hypothetical protein
MPDWDILIFVLKEEREANGNGFGSANESGNVNLNVIVKWKGGRGENIEKRK